MKTATIGELKLGSCGGRCERGGCGRTVTISIGDDRAGDQSDPRSCRGCLPIGECFSQLGIHDGTRENGVQHVVLMMDVGQETCRWKEGRHEKEFK